MQIERGSAGNEFKKNVIGTVVPGNSYAGVWCDGSSNVILDNDFRASGIPGWLTSQVLGCIYLADGSVDNTVIESGHFPAGTGGAREQCCDLGTGNRVVGLPAHGATLHGVGEIVRKRKELLEELT